MSPHRLSPLLLAVIATGVLSMAPGCGGTAQVPTPSATLGQSAAPAKPTHAKAYYLKKSGRQVGLVIGINDYEFGQQIESTRCGQANAKSMAKVLRERYDFDVQELTEANASRASILDRLEQL